MFGHACFRCCSVSAISRPSKTCSSLVRLHAFPRALHFLPCERLRKQVSPCVFQFLWRESCFIADRLGRGSTPPYRDPLRFYGHLMPYTIHRQVVGHSYSFGPSPGMRLLRPLLTSRSGFFFRRPFRHKARSRQVRTHSFPAQPPDLRHFALTTRASRFRARSPCLAAPRIRFLSIGSQFRSTLPPHARSPSRSCASLAVVSSRRDFHPQECAHAERTRKNPTALRQWGSSAQYLGRGTVTG